MKVDMNNLKEQRILEAINSLISEFARHQTVGKLYDFLSEYEFEDVVANSSPSEWVYLEDTWKEVDFPGNITANIWETDDGMLVFKIGDSVWSFVLLKG